MKRSRKFSQTSNRGFTLVELLVVVGILLALTGIALAIFNTGKSSDRMRSAARIAQSAFLGAKDRALHAKDLRGIRLTRDQTNGNLINGFAYMQAMPVQTTGNLTGGPIVGNFEVQRPDMVNATQIQITGTIANTWNSQDSRGIWPIPPAYPMIRIPSGTGQWYALLKNSNFPPYWCQYSTPSGVPTLLLKLQTPYMGGKPPVAPTYDAIDTFDVPQASCDLRLGNDLLPFHQPISLPSGCVIDLQYSSPNVQALAGGVPAVAPYTNIDIMFSPRGMIAGQLQAQGPLHFCIRELGDATANLAPTAPNVRGDCLILTVFPQTGLVQTFAADLVSGNLFSYAQSGQTAGQ
jgi:prepilin-type N-terminal cleavage/methylation domain-containing protein